MTVTAHQVTIRKPGQTKYTIHSLWRGKWYSGELSQARFIGSDLLIHAATERRRLQISLETFNPVAATQKPRRLYSIPGSISDGFKTRPSPIGK
jgi:hypothetical protein